MKRNRDNACSAGWAAWLLLQLGSGSQLHLQEADLSSHLHANRHMLFWFWSTIPNSEIWDLEKK